VTKKLYIHSRTTQINNQTNDFNLSDSAEQTTILTETLKAIRLNQQRRLFSLKDEDRLTD